MIETCNATSNYWTKFALDEAPFLQGNLQCCKPKGHIGKHRNPVPLSWHDGKFINIRGCTLEVDCGIAEVVILANSFPLMRTWASCQGGLEDDGSERPAYIGLEGPLSEELIAWLPASVRVTIHDFLYVISRPHTDTTKVADGLARLAVKLGLI